MSHLSRRHSQALETIQRESAFLSGFLILGLFDTEDPALRQTLIEFGQHFRNLTAPPSIPIAHFQEMAAAMGLEQADPHYQMMVQALQNVQDYHLGKFTPGHRQNQKYST